MNRQEHRTLRAIERTMKADDPELAELLGSFGSGSRAWRHWLVGVAAVLVFLLGVSMGDVLFLLTGVLLGAGAILMWTVQAPRRPTGHRDLPPPPRQ